MSRCAVDTVEITMLTLIRSWRAVTMFHWKYRLLAIMFCYYEEEKKDVLLLFCLQNCRGNQSAQRKVLSNLFLIHVLPESHDWLVFPGEILR